MLAVILVSDFFVFVFLTSLVKLKESNLRKEVPETLPPMFCVTATVLVTTMVSCQCVVLSVLHVKTKF